MKHMKNVLKTLGLVSLAILGLPHRALAVNLGDAQLAVADETANAGSVVGGVNLVNGVNLFFTGKDQDGSVAASSGAYVTISATAMTFYQPFGTVDSSVGTAGVITYASTLGSNTMGALCDYLASLGASYRCTLQGTKRDDLPGVVLKTQTATDGTNNLAAAGGLSVLITTNTFVSLGIIPAPGRRVVLKQCVVNGQDNGAGGNLYVYGQLRKFGAVASPNATDRFGVTADDTYNVWTSSTVRDTTATVPSSNALPRWIEFAQGAHVVIRAGIAGNSSAAAQTASNGVQCAWDEK